jgi:hypothetical protein
MAAVAPRYPDPNRTPRCLTGLCGESRVSFGVRWLGLYEAGITRFEETTIAAPVVDNDLYWYVLRAHFAPDSYDEFDLGLYGVTVDYDLP